MKGPLITLALLTFFGSLLLWAAVNLFVENTNEGTHTVIVSPAVPVPPNDDIQIGSPAVVKESSTQVVAAKAVAEQAEQETGAAILGHNEIRAREAARRQRLAELDIVTQTVQPEPTIAIDVSLDLPEHCEGAHIARVPIGVKFRFESSLIKGESLNALESLTALFRKCASGRFVLAQNPLGRTDATEILTQMRFDEIKYFFIQHSVSMDNVQFSEK